MDRERGREREQNTREEIKVPTYDFSDFHVVLSSAKSLGTL
jgi:hypothetical protein